jgi:hypothetical protein
MTNPIHALVQAIHATPTKVVVITTGGGTAILPTLLERGGGSATLIGGIVPYDPEETISILGGKPDKVVSEPVGRSLAMAAYQRAKNRSNGPVAGIGSTSICQRTPEERLGRLHAFYVAFQTATKTVSLSLEYDDAHEIFGTEDAYAIRAAEENLNVLMMLNAVAEACGLSERIALPHSLDDSVVRTESVLDTSEDFLAFMQGQRGVTSFTVEDWEATSRPVLTLGDAMLPSQALTPSFLVMPGSFNPAHDGHFAMAETVERLTGQRVDFEITVRNADKPPVDLISLECRLASVSKGGKRNVLLTAAPTFVEKARLLPKTTFVVGYDTALRIVEPRFYGGEAGRDAAIAEFGKLGTNFIVFGRVQDGVFCDTLDPNVFPESFRALCSVVKDFRMDVSSTEKRRTTA